jgi:hypothetical protein
VSDITGVADGFITGGTQSSGGLCSTWLTADEMRPDDCAVCSNVTADTPDDATIEAAILAASEYLNAVTGFQFPGNCETTVRPCSGEGWGGLWAWAPIPFVLPDGIWPFWGAGCGCFGGCDCCGPSGFSLGHIPIIGISQVKLDGDVLVEDDDYTVVDDILVRLNPDNPSAEAFWPSCQNIALPDTEPNTFSVTFTWGAAPPAMGILAARDLACMLIGAQCGDEACRPAQRLTQKVAGGTTLQFIAPDADISKQLPNSVRMFLEAFMPNPIARRRPKVRRPNTGTGYIWTPPVTAAGYQRAGWMGGACIGCS